jgi:5'-phosphate synthase pdxT subunit
MAREVHNPVQSSLGLMDISVERNGYGRQIDSFIDTIIAPELAPDGIEGVFIRAPTIREIGESVQVLGRWQDQPVCVTQGTMLACSFHPELTSDLSIHRHFIEMIRSIDAGAGTVGWQTTSGLG